MINKHDITRDQCMLTGKLSDNGYDWWWHSFTAKDCESGEEKPFFIEFFLINPMLAKEVPVFGQQLKDGKNIKPSYLMIKAGCWGEDACQLHRFFPWKDANVHYEAPFSVKAADCYLDENNSYGHIKVINSKNHPEYMCDDGEISWNLKIDKEISFNVGYGASKALRKLNAFNMFWHAEGMKTAFSGEIIFNGRKYIVDPESSYGYADKNWGKDFTSPWVWISSNNITSMITGKKLYNTVFDIGGGCPKVGPIPFKRKLLSAFYYEGSQYEFNFSKFWTINRTVFDCRETPTQVIWHIDQRTLNNRLRADITCDKKDMLLVNYEAPNGLKRHNRLWNGGNGKGMVSLFHKGRLVDKMHVENVGCEYGEYTF